MYTSDKDIGLGGYHGRFALYLTGDFSHGTSFEVASYSNRRLSKNQDFTCCKLELWGLLD